MTNDQPNPKPQNPKPDNPILGFGAYGLVGNWGLGIRA